MRYVGTKSDHYKLSYEPAKLGRLLAHTYCLYYEYVTRCEKKRRYGFYVIVRLNLIGWIGLMV